MAMTMNMMMTMVTMVKPGNNKDEDEEHGDVDVSGDENWQPLFRSNPFSGAYQTRSKPKQRIVQPHGNRDNRSILATLSSILPMFYMREASHLWE